MSTYITEDNAGVITSVADWQFPGSIEVDFEVVQGVGGLGLYKKGEGSSPTLPEAQTAKRAEINAGFDAALIASLTMPSVNTPPSAVEVAVGAAGLAAVDPDGPAYIMQTHEARRAALLAAVDAATTPEAVQAITVSYAV